MYYPPLGKKSSDGGVEEKKEDCEPITLSPDHHYNHHPATANINGLHHRYLPSQQLSPNNNNNDDIPLEPTNINMNNGNNHKYRDEGHKGHFQNILKTIIDSCESIVTFFVRGGEVGCPWPGSGGVGTTGAAPAMDGSPRHRPAAVVQPPLSITEELRKLAQSEGRVFGGGMRRADIPRFLGEEAVYSFDDDNISAISQHTLEEMTRHGIKHPVRRKLSSESSQSVSSLQPPPFSSHFQEREGPPSIGKIV